MQQTNPEKPAATLLTGKKILFLGSSVTYGFASNGTSFAEIISQKNQSICVKEAVSGTTLVDTDDSSYVARLSKYTSDRSFDLVVCQLSTNDATKNLPLGNAGDDDLDCGDVCGAIRYIADYVRRVWGCPLLFYTGAYYDSDRYSLMCDALAQIAQKHGLYVADMYRDAAFNAISAEKRADYMADPIHPTFAGYSEWWAPFIESKMLKIFGE